MMRWWYLQSHFQGRWFQNRNFLFKCPRWSQTVDWKAVVLFPYRSTEPRNTQLFRSFLEGGQVQRLYLEDFMGVKSDLLGVQLMQLILSAPNDSIPLAKELLKQSPQKIQSEVELRSMLDLIETAIVYKFPNLSREAIEQMLGVSELKKTRVYQEALEEGRQEGEQRGRTEGRAEGRAEEGRSLVLRQLQRRLGSVPVEVEAQVQSLDLPQIEALSDALLDFSQLSDLTDWLGSNG